jgi:hypothetical protein
LEKDKRKSFFGEERAQNWNKKERETCRRDKGSDNIHAGIYTMDHNALIDSSQPDPISEERVEEVLPIQPEPSNIRPEEVLQRPRQMQVDVALVTQPASTSHEATRKRWLLQEQSCKSHLLIVAKQW